MKLALFLLCHTLAATANHVLPWYIKQCSISDPNLNQCILRNGNLAIPEMVKGDCFFNNPISVPLFVPEINLLGDDFTASLRSVYVRGFETFKLTDVGFNLANRDQFIVVESPILEISADYIIYDRNKLIRSVQGGGKLEAVLHQNIANYTPTVEQRQENGKIYLNLLSDNLRLTTKKIYHEFSGIYSNYYGNLNWFIKKQKIIIDEKLRPAMAKLLLNYLSNITINLSKKLSVFEIFTP
ncbi:hemolymph juvenile hormone binding protein (JHBP) [Popillia japonica]|uniref:Hemolymph juvenile hormone binding protein (JHBP) n=1 Tax=Popillia japonica TaxID=7064 RepID=A0AAW1IDE7_POPJA